MTKRITRMALLTAVALIIFIVEAQLPPLAPIPGIKAGLSNIITVYSMFRLGPADTLVILLARIFLGNVFAGSVSTMMFSLGGGLLCYLAMFILRGIFTTKQMWVCSVIGAMAHNVGQILVSIAIYRTTALVIYLPVLLLSGVISGIFTGLCAQFVYERLENRL